MAAKCSSYGGVVRLGVEYHYNGIVWAITWNRNKVINLWMLSVREVLQCIV